MLVQGMHFNPRNVETIRPIKKRPVLDLVSVSYKDEDFDGWEIKCISDTTWYISRTDRQADEIHELIAQLDKDS